MKRTSLPALLCAATLTLHAAETKTLTLELGKAPVFSSFTDAGVRFANPDSRNYPVPGMPGTQPGISLTSEPIHLKLTFEGKPVADLGETKVHISFSGTDLKAPGEFYPPPAPVQADTPVSSIGFSIADEPLDQVDARLLPLAKALGTAAEPLALWLKHDLWKYTQSFQAEQSTTLPYTVLTVARDTSNTGANDARNANTAEPVTSNTGANDSSSADKDQKPRFSAHFRHTWKQPENPNRQNPNRVRMVPPPQMQQPPQPGVR